MCDHKEQVDKITQRVYPTLLKGLTVLCKEKPEDPIRYLANWLIENNPYKPRVAIPEIPPPTIVQPQKPGIAQSEKCQQENSRKIIISLMGGPGSGKGTVSEKICRDYDVGYMSAGDLLRKKAKTDPELEKQLSQGIIVPQEITIGLLKQEIETQNKQFYIIDGFPRHVPQSDAFEEIVQPFTAQIFLDVPDDILVQRLIARASTSGRSDDNEETIKNRIQVFHNQSYPVFEHFLSLGKAYKINGTKSPEEVYDDVKVVLQKLLA